MPPGSPTHGSRPPDSLTWRVDSSSLSGTRFTTVRIHDELPSTNTALMEEARGGAPEGLVLVADHQTAGRGRLGRTWSAKPGTALLVSVLLRPPLPVDELPLVLMATGLAACDGVEAAAGFRPRLKWPNDLVVEDRKLAGMLSEAAGGGQPAVVVGIGINVSAGAYPEELSAEATSCEEVASRPVDRSELLVAFLTGLEARYSAVLGRKRSSTLEAYRADSATLGRRVRVDLMSGDPLEGRATRLAGDGRLIVTDDAGAEHAVHVGDVRHLRT